MPRAQDVGVATEFECVTDLPVSPQVAFELSLSIELHLASMAKSGERAIGGLRAGQLGLGQEVTWRARHFGLPWRMTSRITALEPPTRFVDEQVRGPFSRFRHEHLYEPTESGTRMTDRVLFAAPFGIVGRAVERLVLNRYLRHLIEARNEFLTTEATRA
jgi:ligand-binding SRPBCC domain-containing protein